MANTYKGPGKLFSTVGGWFVGGLVGGLVATALLFVPGGVFLAPIAFAAGNIVGAVKGYQSAARGQRQFEEAQIAVASTRVQPAYTAQSYAPQMGATRFTDRIQSRATQGSYADAVLADRARSSEQAR